MIASTNLPKVLNIIPQREGYYPILLNSILLKSIVTLVEMEEEDYRAEKMTNIKPGHKF